MHIIHRSVSCILLASVITQAQPDWTPPITITRDTINEQDAAISNFTFGSFFNHPTEEFMAFVRNGRQICIKRTEGNGTRWSDSMYCVPNDSAQFSHPTLTYTRIPGTSRSMLVLVWVASETLQNSNLMYTTWSDEVWNQPAYLTTQSAGDRNPHLAPHDSGVGVVWQRGGRIMYSRFIAGGWSPPEYVTPPGDTLNSKPQLFYDRNAPVLLWHKRKAPDTTLALYCSIKRASGWRQPDTFAYAQDNRSATFFKPHVPGSLFAVCWSRAVSSGWQVVARNGDYSYDTLRKTPIEPLSSLQREGLNILPSANLTPLPITRTTSTPVWYIVAAWQSHSLLEGPGIAATRWAGSSYTLFTGANASTFRNPVVSAGAFSYPYLRIWIVWEGMENNRWKLYGSYSTFMVTDVPEMDPLPAAFVLYQNYPNPLSAKGGSPTVRQAGASGGNPSTSIKFLIPNLEPPTHVVLKVYDVLGREVATLVNELKPPGEYTVQFDANNLPSGVYFYQLRAGTSAQTKKMLLVR